MAHFRPLKNIKVSFVLCLEYKYDLMLQSNPYPPAYSPFSFFFFLYSRSESVLLHSANN